MLKIIVDSLDEVDEADRRHYEQTDDGYRLAFEGGLEKLKNTERHHKQRRKDAEARVAELEEQLRVARATPAVSEADNLSPRERYMHDNVHRLNGLTGEARDAMIATIVDEMQPFIDEDLAEHRKAGEAQLAKLSEQCVRLTRETAARSFLREIARDGASIEVLLPHVLNRFGAEERGGEYTAFVTDDAGRPSKMSMEALKEEFRASPTFGLLVRGASEDEKAAHAKRVAVAIGATVATQRLPGG